MKRIKGGIGPAITAVLLTASLLVSGAVTAGAASAHSLVLKAEGTIAPVGTVSFVEMTINVEGNPSNCDFGEYNGRLVTNSQPTDTVTNAIPVELNHCSAGTSIAGTITEAAITSKGRLTLKASPKLALTVPGGCTYEMSKLTASFPVPGFAYSSAESAKAKLSKTSSRSCAKSAHIEGGVAVGLNEPPRFADFELEVV